MPSKIKQKGATLIELIIVIIILSIITVGGAELLRLGFNAYATGQEVVEADWQGRLAMERMTRDLHTLRSVSTATSSTFSFVDASGVTITYQVIGNQLQRNGLPLADNIQSIVFSYFDSNGNLTASNAAIRYIAIAFSVSTGHANFNYITGISLWNL